jgi:CheY-like chemotaxis protein
MAMFWSRANLPVPSTVLIAADDNDVREQIAWCLRAAGYRAVTARTGLEALAAMSSSGVDLLLVDLEMADRGGRSVLEHVAGDPRLRRIPVLVVTDRPHEAPRELATIIKPFTSERLIETVTGMVGSPRRQYVTPLRNAPIRPSAPPPEHSGRNDDDG